jgi:PTS system galactitol-specific IIA component
MIWEELKDSLIFTGLEAKGYEDIMKQVGKRLIQEGYCKDTYVDALIVREKEYPTGIDVEGVGVAIPHTDVSHVNQQGIAIAVLKQPVTFTQMGTDDEFVQVQVVFVLAVVDPNEHIEHLERILKIIQDKQVLSQMQQAKDTKQIMNIIKSKEDAL